MNKQENQFKTFFEQASESIFFTGLDASIIDVNEAGCNLLGYTHEELTKLTLPDVLSPDEAERIGRIIDVLSNGEIVKGNWKFKRKDQHVFIGEVSGKKLSDGWFQAIVREIAVTFHEEAELVVRRFSLSFDHLLEGCQIIGFDWRYLYLNQAAERHNHRPGSELLGCRYQDVWPGVEDTEIYLFMKLTLEERVPVQCESEFIYPDGSRGWFDLSMQPIPEGLFILSIDITERKIAEQSLRENEERYRLVIDNTSEWIYWMTPQKKLNYISPACEKITGYSMNEFRADPGLIIEITHPDDKDLLIEHFAKINAQDTPHNFEFRIITRDNEIRWISHTCSAIINSNGEFLGRRAVNRNVTDLKLKEELLRESELRFSKLYEKGPFGMAIVESDFKWRSINPTLVKMFGYTHKELQQMTFLDVTHPDDRRKNLENVRKLVNNEIQIFRSDKRYVKKNGQTFWGALTVIANFNEEGKHLYNLAIIEDISRRKKDEESIEAQNALLNSILNSSSDVFIFALDRNYCYTSFNEKHRLEMKKAWNAEISLGDNFLDFLTTPTIREAVQISIGRTWKGESFSEVLYHPSPPTYYEFSWSPIFKRAEVTGTTVFVKDVTQSKKAEKALRESEEKFRVIFEANPDSITITRIEDGMYFSVNKGFTQLFGYTAEEAVGKTSRDIDLWVDFTERAQFIAVLKKNGYVENCEIRLKGKDQRSKPILISSIFIDIGGELCILTDARDISGIKRQQEELRKSEALLNEVGRIAKIGGWEFSPITGESSWTEEVARIHDLDPKTPASVKLSLNYYTSQSRPIIEKAFNDCIEQAKPYDLELEIISAIGQHKWIRTIGQPIIEKGKVIKVHGAFLDITENKIVEQELIQAKERAEAGDRLKSAFISNISHEIRTPLNGIIGFAQIITDPFFSAEDKVQYRQWLNESSDRLINTITNIMDVSLLTSGSFNIKRNKVMIKNVLDRAGEGFTYMCLHRNLFIVVESDHLTGDDYLFTDEEKLSRILFQLVDNAVKFTEKGTITISAVKCDHEFHFQVKDTGIGISTEYKSQIYDYFTQIDNTMSRKYEGSGIGLSIAKGFVNLLGGNIWVDSEKGKGTSFNFSIPAGSEN